MAKKENKDSKQEVTVEDIESILKDGIVKKSSSVHIEKKFIDNSSVTKKIFGKLFDLVESNGNDSQNNSKNLETGKGRIYKTLQIKVETYDSLVKIINGYGLNLNNVNLEGVESESDKNEAISKHISKEVSYHNGSLEKLCIPVKIRNSSSNGVKVISVDIPIEGYVDRF